MTEPEIKTFAGEMQELLEASFPPLQDLDEDDGITPSVRKLTTYQHFSCCMLTDATGVNHCTHPPAPRWPLRRRLRWALRSRWATLRLRLGSWIAGVNLDEDNR